MLATLDAHTIQSRLDAKYGPGGQPAVKKAAPAIDETPTSTVRFCPLPAPSAVRLAAYTPRPMSLDGRRGKLIGTYIDCPDLQDLRHLRAVPPVLTRIARWGMRDVLRPGTVRVGNAVVALVSSREVGALLLEVARSTSGLPPHKCTRLVVHMCTNDAIAREWLECFGP